MISVVIPTYNEESIIERTLSELFLQKGNFEVVVVDGNSNDNTLDKVKKFDNVRVFKLRSRGRSLQMNFGARKAKGNILLFLHADTILCDGAFLSIEETLSDSKIVGGGFALKFDRKHFLLNFYYIMIKLAKGKILFGDQAIFVRRKTFFELCGYKELYLMEDVDFVRRLSDRGKLKLIKEYVVTSSRRLDKNGLLKQTLLDIYINIIFLLGYKNTKKLRQMYERCSFNLFRTK